MKFPEVYRWQPPNPRLCSAAGSTAGMFQVPGRHACGRMLRIVACDAEFTGWEHVSVSIADQPTRCPSWEEMCLVKALFWEPEDCVVQFHPPQSEYVNNHAGCLHLWRHVDGHVTPPRILVGI